MPPHYQELHKQQATSNNWLGPDALWAMVRTLENPPTTTPLQQQHFLQPQK
jgi:hypothetical protein